MFIGISLRTDSIRQQNEEISNRSLLSHLWIFLYQKTIFFMLYRQRSSFFYEIRIKPLKKISPFRKRASEPGRTQKTKYAAVSRIPSEVAVGRRVQGSVKRNVFVKPNEQSRKKFELCRGEKWTKEIQPKTAAARRFFVRNASLRPGIIKKAASALDFPYLWLRLRYSCSAMFK